MSLNETKLLENAVASIEVGIDDYRHGGEDRLISSVRNFYAGVLLLGKQCLLEAAETSDPMSVLASKFEPFLDEDASVKYKPVGTKTVDLHELKGRFEKFDLSWPQVDIKRLQKLRNNLEHYHAQESNQQMQEIIAECFPIIESFFRILKLNPSEKFLDAWSTMLDEKKFFSKMKNDCRKSLEKINLPALVNLDKLECEVCSSTLLYQENSSNTDPDSVKLKCKSCGEEDLAYGGFTSFVANALFGADDYISCKDSGEAVICDCPDCGESLYVNNGEINICFSCGYSVSGSCGRCSEPLNVNNMSVNNSSLCDYCDHIVNKDD